MKERIIIKTGSTQAVQSAVDGMVVLWIKDLGNGNVAAAVSNTHRAQSHFNRSRIPIGCIVVNLEAIDAATRPGEQIEISLIITFTRCAIHPSIV